MVSKFKIISAVALIINASLMVAFVPSAEAKTREKLRCNESRCTFKVRLGKSMTKEFMGVCTSPYNPYTENMSIRKTAKDTTCTIKCRAEHGKQVNISKSCTNWNPIKRDNLKVIVQCGDYPLTSGGIGDLCSESTTK